MTRIMSVCVAAISMGVALVGCSDNSTADDSTKEPVSKNEGNGATPVVFANEKGEALCPVMGEPIADTSDAKFEDYEGKRYYFCCGDCPDKFHAEPAKYADGKAMPKDGSM